MPSELKKHQTVSLIVAAALGLAGLLAAAGWFWLAGQNEATQIVSLSSPATTRLQTDHETALQLLAALDVSPPPLSSVCAPCRAVEEARRAMVARTQRHLHAVRQIEASPGPDGEADLALASAREDLGRSITGLRLLTERASICEQESFCTGADDMLAGETIDCQRDRELIEDAAQRARTFAQTLIERSARCENMTCPQIDCDLAASMGQDLDLAAATANQLASVLSGERDPALARRAERLAAWRRDALPVIEHLEQKVSAWLARIADGTIAQTDPRIVGEIDALRADTTRLIDRLEDREATEGNAALPEELWRLRTVDLRLAGLIEEVRIADRNGEEPDRQEEVDAFADILLNLARIQGALQSDEVAPTASEPDCPITGMQDAAEQLRAARAALSLCQARVGCRAGSGKAAGDLRSTDALGALRRLTDTALVDPSRLPAQLVSDEGELSLSLSRQTYFQGEAIAVDIGSAGSACLAEGGSIALFDAANPSAPRRHYRLFGRPEGGLLFEAAEPGRYAVQVDLEQMHQTLQGLKNYLIF